MFAFYTLSSVGILWLEVSVAALFLGEYGAESLPWIYIASAGIGTGFGFLYAWLQKWLPLRQVIVITAGLMAVPLFLFRLELHPALLGGYTIFLMRLWLEAIYVINEINTSITANQLFTIREIKRTYPLISSGILAADVLSGLSLPLLRSVIGLGNVIWLAGAMLCGGAAILLYLTQIYRQFFPDGSRRRTSDKPPDFTNRQVQGPLRRYIIWVIVFFVLLQILSLLLDFQYLSQLEQNVSVETIADFLALFSACLGILELITQWFVSGRMIERFGIFRVAQFPPLLILLLSGLSLTRLLPLFVGVILLKFVDELLRYTLVASTSPVLFQPLPEVQRGRVQSQVRGIAEPLATGLTGVSMLFVIWLFQGQLSWSTAVAQQWQSGLFLGCTALLAGLWWLTVHKMRAKYLEVLVLSADWGKLSLSQVDAQRLKRELREVLNRPDSQFDKDAYIDLLIRTDPKTASTILAPQLLNLSPELQRRSLEVMLKYPDPAYAGVIQTLMEQASRPDVLAAAMRYFWLTDPVPNLERLRPYCQLDVDPVVRSTATALMLRLGNPQQKAEATDILRRMLTHKQEQERRMGCLALADALYLQSLRLYIRPLLQDESLPVRCAVLEAIAATHAEDYYPALLRGLYYQPTREAAQQALVRLENDAIPLLQRLADNVYQPTVIRNQAWSTIGQIGTPEAIHILVTRLMTSWGPTRKILLQVLLRLPQEQGIDAVADELGRSGIETLMIQELQFLAHIYAARLDLATKSTAKEIELLHRALRGCKIDAIERLFLLMQFLYDSDKIRAAAFNLQSDSRDDRARGLEILDNTLDIPKKQTVLHILDSVSKQEKLCYLAEFISYRPMKPQQRLRYLLDLRHFLSDWVIACCFHLARRAHWKLTGEQTLACLRSPTGFVREAVLAYLRAASPKALGQVLPALYNDPDPLVFAQVSQMMAELGLEPPPNPKPRPQATERILANFDSDLELI
ncbi:MFS transporter [Leptolyngbya sp. NK1-12]|uniref:MFS transporter n=1 Tax=Leptolyngbya sp. NK1-12 TaxID=2547451 RepID=UPI002931B223|nr:MFS transporter [Leptolyngbya sp. NK1-12]